MGFTGKKKRKTQRRMTAAQKRKLMLLTGLVFVCALFVVGIFYSSVYRYVHKMRPGQIEENVYVQGVDMSGLTKAQAKKKLKQNWEAVQNTHLILHDGEKEASVTVKQMGIRQGDVDEAIEKAAEYAKRGGLFHRYRKIRAAKKEKVEYDVSYKIDEEQIEDLLEEKTKDFYEEAEDAGITRVGGVFQITEEKSGETIDIDAVMKELEDKLPSLLLGEETRINVSAKKDEPKVTKTDLESIEDRIGEFATETQEEDRSLLSRTSELLNGQVILAEKEISVQKILAPLLEMYEEENQDEKAETDIDCPEAFSQAASTLYMAVLDAELEVIKREPLDHEAAYTKPAMDAALDTQRDLQIKNTLDAPVYIEVFIDQNEQFVCRIYGTRTREKTTEISFESEILEEHDPETEYVADEEIDAGKMKKESDGSRMIRAKLWKIVEEEGEEVSRDEINETTYKGENQKILVGTKSDDEETVEKLEKAVESQDEKEIEETIKEINGEE